MFTLKSFFYIRFFCLKYTNLLTLVKCSCIFIKKNKDLTEKYSLEKKEFENYSLPKIDYDELLLKKTLEECLIINFVFFIILLVIKYFTKDYTNFFAWSLIIFIFYAININNCFFTENLKNKKKIKSKKMFKKIKWIQNLSCLFLILPFTPFFYLTPELLKIRKRDKVNKLEFDNIKTQKKEKLDIIEKEKNKLLGNIMKDKISLNKIKEDKQYLEIKKDVEDIIKKLYVEDLELIDLYILQTENENLKIENI